MKRPIYLIVPLIVLTVLGASVLGFNHRRAVVPQAAVQAPPAASDSLANILTPVIGDDKLDQQIAKLQENVRQDPRGYGAVEKLGWAFVAKARTSSDPGFYTLAEQAAKVIQSNQPNDPGALLLMGHVDHALHRFADAEAVARKLTGEREFVFDYALLGDALMEQGKLSAAVTAYQTMVDLKPCLQTYSRVAYMRWLKGDLAGAIEASRLAVSGGSPREPEPIAWAYTRLAMYELQAGNISRAQANADLALGFVGDYAPALLMRGRLQLAQGNYAEAVQPLRRAAELSPLPDYLWTLAEALRASGNDVEATAVESRLAATGAAADGRTFSLFLASHGEKAGRSLELATAELQSRQDIFTHDAVAWAALQAGDLSRAREEMKLALSEGTQDARLFYHAGMIAAADGAKGEALGFLGKAHAIEQMLLPSERTALGERLATLTTAGSSLSSN